MVRKSFRVFTTMFVVSVLFAFFSFNVFANESLIYETNELTLADSNGEVYGVVDDAGASGGSFTYYMAKAAGDYIVFAVDIPEAGSYEVGFGYASNANQGQFQFYYDDVKLGSVVDQYADPLKYESYTELGKIEVKQAGEIKLKIECVGMNEAATSLFLLLDFLEFTPVETPVTEATTTVDEPAQSNPKTGDAGTFVYIFTAGAAALGAISVLRKRK